MTLSPFFDKTILENLRPDASPLATIYLVRHGITPANKENRFAGRSDEPLHPDGILQIEGVGEKLKSAKIQRIYAGPLPRTRQSAEILSGLVDAPITVDERLNEIVIPHWNGLTKDVIRQRFGSEYPTWLSDPAGFRISGCETLEDVQKRAVSCVENIFSAHDDEAIIIVSHLIVVRCLVLHYKKIGLSDFRSIKINNAALIRLTKDEYGKTSVSDK